MKNKKTYIIQAALFIFTVLCTTMIGAELILARPIFTGSEGASWTEFAIGFYYSVPFLGFLTAHEFGHYITARLYKIKVTLPYYIPLFFGIGTMGAFIRIKEPIKSRKEYFDVGIAGPIAGFVVAIGVLWYGFATLPPAEYIYEIHPEYAQYGSDYASYVYEPNDSTLSLAIGSNLIFEFFERYIVKEPERIPNAYEMMHYPWLFAGFLATFFTALNLIPIGQLDGGHVLYGLLGFKKHKYISSALFIIFVGYAGMGVISPSMPTGDFMLYGPLYLAFLYLTFSRMYPRPLDKLTVALSVLAGQLLLGLAFPDFTGYTGWLLFAFIIGRFLGVYHPPALIDQPLDWKRKVLGWVAVIIFVISFSPAPFVV